jgi:hypothetical protein
MKWLLLIISILTTSCSILGGGGYKEPCEKILESLKSDELLWIEVGFANVVATDWSRMEFRGDSVGDFATYQLSKSNLLQKLYQEQYTADIRHIDEARLKSGETAFSSTKDEDLHITSKKMVTLYCGGSVYGIVNKGDFK